VTLDDLGNLGDFVGGALVVASLFYLALQIRQNTVSLRAAAFQESVRAANELSALLAAHPDLHRILRSTFVDFDALDAEERGRASQLLYIALRNFSLNLHLAERSLVPAEVCESYEFAMLPFLRSPAGRAWWRQNERLFDASFRRHVEERIAV
jgi:hypothetical protein